MLPILRLELDNNLACTGFIPKQVIYGYKELAGINWEIYGDWNEDESKLETEIFYLLM